MAYSSNSSLPMKDSEEEPTLESFIKDFDALSETSPICVTQFGSMLNETEKPSILVNALESINELLEILNDRISESHLDLKDFEAERKSLLIKRAMVLKRLESILAHTE